MSDQAITTLSSLSIVPDPDNNNNGFYLPQLTAAQIAAIPVETLRNGALIYNTTTNTVEARVNGVIVTAVTPGGTGDVNGPAGAVDAHIATFDGATGKQIADSGVIITRVPAAPATLLNKKNKAFVDVAEIGNLGHVKFVDDVGIVFVDTLMPVEFIVNDFGLDSQACSLFTGGLPSSSTTVSSLVEIQSTTGALVVSRMTEAERDLLFATAGMLLFNTDTNKLNLYDGTDWIFDVISENTVTQNLFVGSTSGSNSITSASTNLGIGGNTLNALTTGDNNIALGQGSLANITVGANNIAIGSGSLANITTSNNSVAIGVNCLQKSTSSTNNVGVGPNVLINNINGNGNVGLGGNALLNNLSGSSCVAVGENALRSNTFGSNNVGIGRGALDNNTLGSENICLGERAYANNITGSGNVIIGDNASEATSNANDSISIGSFSSVANFLTNAIVIGANATVTRSDAMVLGKGCFVGIGTSNPLSMLHLSNAGVVSPLLRMDDTAVPAAPSASNGIYSVNAGKPIFTTLSTTYSGTIHTLKVNATYGTAILNGTTGVIVPTTSLTANSVVMLTRALDAGVPALTNLGQLVPGNRVNGVSFTIFSSNAGDIGRIVNWMIVQE